MIKVLKRLSKKSLVLLVIISIFFTSFNFNYILSLIAAENQEIVFVGGTSNGGFVEFKDGETLMGKV